MNREFEKVYIVILNWNSYSDTNDCLTSIFNLDYPNFSIIVCDNGSTDRSLFKIEEHIKSQSKEHRFLFYKSSELWEEKIDKKEIILIDNKNNLGYAAGNNVGIRLAMKDPYCKHVWVLNNDTIVERNTLCEMMQKVRRYDNYGVCGARLIFEHDRTKLQGFGGLYNSTLGISSHYMENEPYDTVINENEIAEKMDYLIGASLLLSRAFINYSGGFSEDYFLYFEELDLFTRMEGKYDKIIASNAIVYHKEGASFNNAKKGASLYYLHRNRIFFTKKFHPDKLLSVYCYSVWSIMKRLFKMDVKSSLIMSKAILNLKL